MSFALHKILSGLIEPLNLLALLLLLAALASFLPWERGGRAAQKLVLFLALLLFVPAIVPVGSFALAPLENRFPAQEPKNVDGILLLTTEEKVALSDARGEPLLGAAAQNYLTLARLAQKYPKAKLVVVGDPAPFFRSKKTSLESVVRETLMHIGVPAERVKFEPKSRTTYENALFTAKLIRPSKDETWLLVSAASHLPRATLTFEKQGWNVVPYPGSYLTPPKPGKILFFELAQQMRLLDLAAHEYVGLVYYWVQGWIERPWR